MSINFCHIAPVNYLQHIKRHKVHLLLAHLVEENPFYRGFYRDLKCIAAAAGETLFYHLDNSAFEMFKRGKPMYPADKLLQMAEMCSADSIVMSDYPKENYLKTVEQAVELIPRFKDAGYKTFFCPQSELGKINDLIGSFDWAIHNPNIDYIGVSILACPIGLGVQEGERHERIIDDAFRMQRYLSRWQVFELLRENGLLGKKTLNRFHCLGMTDGPNEISLLRQYHEHIYSWDSSSAIWHGINGIKYDMSPTGLKAGKFETEVDFDVPLETHAQHARGYGSWYNSTNHSVDIDANIVYNMGLIDAMCEGS